jgi:hypothetical protein
MKRLLLILLLALIPATASAGVPTYNGNLVVPTGATLTIQGATAGCAIVQANGTIVGAVCPTGTAIFSGTAPIVLTGTGPYAITCPTCFTTTGGTISGATAFSSSATFNGLVTVNTNANITGRLVVGAATGVGVGGDIAFGRTTSTAAAFFGNTLTFLDFGVTNGANYTFTGGNVYAPLFLTTSLRSHKQDIHPLKVDGLAILRATDWASFRYLPKYGNPKETHIGYIADDTPSLLSGPKHDHFDAQAVATVDAQAILQLDRRLTVLVYLVSVLAAIVLAMGTALALRR